MIITKDYIYIHFPRSGGMSLLNSLFRHRMKFKHYFHSSLKYLEPDVIKERTVFGFIRNPVHWYESQYSYYPQFRKTFQRGNPLFNALSNYGEFSFEEYIENATNIAEYFKYNPVALTLAQAGFQSYVNFSKRKNRNKILNQWDILVNKKYYWLSKKDIDSFALIIENFKTEYEFVHKHMGVTYPYGNFYAFSPSNYKKIINDFFGIEPSHRNKRRVFKSLHTKYTIKRMEHDLNLSFVKPFCFSKIG